MHEFEADAAATASPANPTLQQQQQPPRPESKPIATLDSASAPSSSSAEKHVDSTADMTPTLLSDADLNVASSASTTALTSAASSDLAKEKKENKDEEPVHFYMDNRPRYNTVVRNSELAGDDDDDDDDEEDAAGTAARQDINDNKDMSLASVTERAIETLVGLAMIVPDALISPDEEGSSSVPHLDDDLPEVYLDDQVHDDFVGQNRASLPLTTASSATPTAGTHEKASSTNTTTTGSEPSSADDSDISQSVPTVSAPITPGRPCEIGTSKDMLTEGQAFAYVGLCLVTANTLFQALEGKESAHAKESLESFVSKLINRLYRHLDIDPATQKTIAQLPLMMIQPEDLLETFVADGTSRVVSSQQVDQAGLSTPSSPVLSRHSRQFSVTSVSSNTSLSNSVLSRPAVPSVVTALVKNNSSSTLNSDSKSSDPSTTSPSSSSSSSATSIASVPRESVSSQRSEVSFNNVSLETSTEQSSTLPTQDDSESTITASGTTLVSDSRSQSKVSLVNGKAITVDLRWTMIADLFLISISDSVYDARARILLKTVGRHLGLDWHEIILFEKSIMKQLQQATTTDGLLKPDTKSRNDESRKRRMIMMGLATVGGGLVLGLSAGLFAPVIGAGIGTVLAGAHITGATATAASAFLAGSGGIAVITSGAAVTGSGLAMKKMARRTAGIDTFEFLTITDNKRVNVILTIAGWLDIGDEDASLPFSTLDPVNGDHFALFWEPEMLMQLGNALGLLATEVITLTAQEILKHTLLSALLSALAWPMALTRLGYLIDNPWSIALDRAKLAGLVLADSLLMRSYLGFRPVTLVGYSLGARVIFYCLLELGRLDAFVNGDKPGAPSGDFVNGYLRNDWVLGFLFRATTGGLGTVAGLRPIKNVPGLDNMDLTDHVEGHLDYRVKIPLLMKLMGLKVTSESFLDKEEAILYQRSLKINPSETLKAPKPMMPSKAELANSATLSDNEKAQLEAAFRRPAPKAKIPDLDSLTGLTAEEKAALKEALESAAAANAGSPVETPWMRK
ncbi:hypothetical protein BGZ83_005726 [Gryganskiella cystojenkinii]|nr:hypothetical protein BGZ83_005726 [Gryganskiella cystojenkinii]